MVFFPLVGDTLVLIHRFNRNGNYGKIIFIVVLNMLEEMLGIPELCFNLFD